MNGAYIGLILVLIWVFCEQSKRKRMTARRIVQKKSLEERIEMTELAKRFLGKECLIYTFNDNAVSGILKEVTDGAVLVERKGTVEAVNIDFVMRIREYPRNKKGKKKTIVVG